MVADALFTISSNCAGALVPIPILPVRTLIVEPVMVDVALIELALKVEYAATPGVPLLILETVSVDNANELVVMVDPVSVEYAMAVVNRLFIRSVSDISMETG
jgi:hypothetical protein